MTESITLSIVGELNTEQLDMPKSAMREIVEELNRNSQIISDEISERIGLPSGWRVNTTIGFREGSIVWDGIIQLASTAWPTAQALATIGGMVGLVQIIREAVQKVLYRWFRRFGSPLRSRNGVRTSVVVVQVPAEPAVEQNLIKQKRPIDSLFGYAAVVTSMSFFLSAVALLIYVLK